MSNSSRYRQILTSLTSLDVSYAETNIPKQLLLFANKILVRSLSPIIETS